MAGGYRISRKMKDDLTDAIHLLNKAHDTIETDKTPKRTQKYIKEAKEICKKLID